MWVLCPTDQGPCPERHIHWAIQYFCRGWRWTRIDIVLDPLPEAASCITKHPSIGEQRVPGESQTWSFFLKILEPVILLTGKILYKSWRCHLIRSIGYHLRHTYTKSYALFIHYPNLNLASSILSSHPTWLDTTFNVSALRPWPWAAKRDPKVEVIPGPWGTPYNTSKFLWLPCQATYRAGVRGAQGGPCVFLLPHCWNLTKTP